MTSDGDGVDAHLYNWVIVATRGSHIAKIEDIVFFYAELFHEVGHAEFFVHTWDNSVNGGGATDFVVKLGGFLFGESDDFFALFAIWIPGIFLFGAGFLAESRESDLGEAILDDFVAFGELVLFPEAELASGFFKSMADFFYLFVGEGIIINLAPLTVFATVILGALCDEEMKVFKLFFGRMR